jgi:hypothetical protein
MLIGLVFLALFATVPLAGGRVAALAELRFRGKGLLLAAIAAQIVIVSILPEGSATLHSAIHIATYLIVAVFVVANRRIPWVWLIALGGALNFTAIAANGGVMPASRGALAAAGLNPASGEFANSDLVRNAHVAFLGDVFAIPAGWPGANVFSLGDALMLVGAFLVLHAATGSRLLAARRTELPRVQAAPAPRARPAPPAR